MFLLLALSEVLASRVAGVRHAGRHSQGLAAYPNEVTVMMQIQWGAVLLAHSEQQ